MALTDVFRALSDPFYEMKEDDRTAMDGRLIVEAIASGDEELAEETMRKHIKVSWDLLDVERCEEILGSGYMNFSI